MYRCNMKKFESFLLLYITLLLLVIFTRLGHAWISIFPFAGTNQIHNEQEINLFMVTDCDIGYHDNKKVNDDAMFLLLLGY